MPEEIANVEKKSVDIKGEMYTCQTCRWWSRCKPHPEAVELWGMEMFSFGECRGIPPTAIPGTKRIIAQNDPSGNTSAEIKLARFPHTYPTDWCGMWNEMPSRNTP